MNWFRKPQTQNQVNPNDVSNSILHDERTFYNQFTHDLLRTKQEVIIESPFLTIKRLNMFKPIFEKLVSRGVQIFVMTRHPHEHDEDMAEQAEAGIRYFEELGVQVLLCDGYHHRKLAMIDREILWEGSLNILSQSHSREFMRRIASKRLTEEMFKFLRYNQMEFIRKSLNLV